MAIRTTIVNKTKNADGTYSEKEIHPFTDMNAVVSLEEVSGNYDAYTSLPLEGAPQNALTAFLNTRSYLYSLRNFKNKTVTDNYTETTDLKTKVPSMQAFVDGYNSCQRAALNAYNHATEANNNANKRISTLDITNRYHSGLPSETKVLSQIGSTDLYVKSFENILTMMIKTAPRSFLSPVKFINFEAYPLSKPWALNISEHPRYSLESIDKRKLRPYPGTMEIYKITVFHRSGIDTINYLLENKNYNTNDLIGGMTKNYTLDLAAPHFYTRVADNSFFDNVYEEVIISSIGMSDTVPKCKILSDMVYTQPHVTKYFHEARIAPATDENICYIVLEFNGEDFRADEMYYTIEKYSENSLNNDEFSAFLENS